MHFRWCAQMVRSDQGEALQLPPPQSSATASYAMRYSSSGPTCGEAGATKEWQFVAYAQEQGRPEQGSTGRHQCCMQ
jgi:hypothetical protein